MASVSKDIFVSEYLKRLQYTGTVTPNLQTLNELHQRHLLNIPFENLNNIYQQHYATTKHDLFQKIIQGHRGGVCFELNSLFAFLLEDLGYDVTVCSARVFVEKTFVTRDTHQLSLVSLEGQQWMVDVGFGGSFVVPLQLTEDVIQDGLNGFYMLKKELHDGEEQFVLYCSSEAHLRPQVLEFNWSDVPKDVLFKLTEDVTWRCLFKFTTGSKSLSFFDPFRKHVLEAQSSLLNKSLLCTILRPWGRQTLARMKLIKSHIEDKKLVDKQVEILSTRQDVISTLDKEFGVQFDEQYSDNLDVALGLKDK